MSVKPFRKFCLILIFTLLFFAVQLLQNKSFAIIPTPARGYANTPKGYNSAMIAGAYMKSNTSFDTTVRSEEVTGLDIDIKMAYLEYIKTIGLLGQAATVGAYVPFGEASSSISGIDFGRSTSGIGDPVVLFGYTFIGAPALNMREFAEYKQTLILGGCTFLSVPVGKYNKHRVMNLGSNRWIIKQEFAASYAIKKWVLDLYGNVQFFTENDDYIRNSNLEQNPLFGLESHISYSFSDRFWASFDACYASGGETKVNGSSRDNKQNTTTLGVTLTAALTNSLNLQLAYTDVVDANNGPDFSGVTIMFQLGW